MMLHNVVWEVVGVVLYVSWTLGARFPPGFDLESALRRTSNVGNGMPLCTNPAPCDMAVGVFQDGNMEPSITDDAICACSGEQTCPKGWVNETSQTLTLELKARDKDVFIQFHYCDTIPETRECVDDEVAIELDTIAGIFPQKLRKLNCQCSGNGRMVLKRSRQRRFGYLVHQYYSCMLPTCDVNSSEPPLCMFSQEERFRRSYVFTNTNVCVCNEGFTCKMQAQPNSRGNRIRGNRSLCQAN